MITAVVAMLAIALATVGRNTSFVVITMFSWLVVVEGLIRGLKPSLGRWLWAEMGSEIAPFGAILLRSESAASSRIENLTASAKAVALAEFGDTSRRNATEIVANTSAMTAAIALADRLDAPAILAMHGALLEEHDPKIAGTWRGAQVWVGTSSYGPHTANFVPPHHTRVAAAIEDLVRLMRRDDVPVLTQAAIAHAQFETIHPFPDGNGRTGRAIVQCLLRAKRLTRRVTIAVSAGLLTDIGRYFDASPPTVPVTHNRSVSASQRRASTASLTAASSLPNSTPSAPLGATQSPADVRRLSGEHSTSFSNILCSTTRSSSASLTSQ